MQQFIIGGYVKTIFYFVSIKFDIVVQMNCPQ